MNLTLALKLASAILALMLNGEDEVLKSASGGWYPPTVRGGYAFVKEKTYWSDNRLYSLTVSPEDPLGLGRFSADYLFAVEGQDKWCDNRPFTLMSASLDDEGYCFGVAYSQEERPHCDPREFMHIVIIAPSGEELLHEKRERVPPTLAFSSPMAPRPFVSGMVFMGAHRVIVVQTEEPQSDYVTSLFTVYDVESGKRLRSFESSEWKEVGSIVEFVQSISQIGTLPILLVHLVVIEHGENATETGGRFLATTLSGDIIWQQSMPNDYSDLCNLGYLRLDEALQRLRLYSTGPSTPTFAIKSLVCNQWQRFEVRRDHEKWIVDEAGP